MKNEMTEQAPAPVGRELLEARLAQVRAEIEAATIERASYKERVKCLGGILEELGHEARALTTALAPPRRRKKAEEVKDSE